MNWIVMAIDGISKIPWERIIIRPKPQKSPDFSIPGSVSLGESAPQKENVGNTSQKETEGQNLASQSEVATEIPQGVATACVSCALGHFSTSAGLLNEAVRFKKEGITSNEIVDRIGKCLEEQNSLERVDLTPEKIQNTPAWEREIAQEALTQSRNLRHRLEGIQSIDELEQAAADTATYYRKMNRQWYKGRFAKLGKERAEIAADLALTLPRLKAEDSQDTVQGT